MTKQLFTINEAAKLLGVSIKTLRRWDQKGLLAAQRTIGNQRRYDIEELEKLKGKKIKSVIRKQSAVASQLTINEAALFLGISVKTLRRWETKGLITALATPTGKRVFSQKALEKLKGLPVKIEAAQPQNQTPTIQTHAEPEPEILPIFGRPPPPRPFFRQPIFLAAIAFLALGGAFVFTNYGGIKLITNLPTKKILSLIPFNEKLKNQKTASYDQVLAADTKGHDYTLKINVPVEIDNTASISGNLTAPNILYNIVAGNNITISGDAQRPTISATGGVSTFQGETGDLTLSAGTGIVIDGLSISSNLATFKNFKIGSDTISAGSSTDTFEFVAGSGVSLSTDTSSKKLTISGNAASGWTDEGTIVRLTTITDSVGIGTITPAATLDVAGTFKVSSTTSLNGLIYTWPAAQTTGYFLSTDGSGTLSWSDIATSTSNYWRQNSGTVYPANSTVDLLIGGTATTSAKFAVLNVNSGTPTASISGATGALFLTADGTLQTTRNQQLIIGGANSGDVNLSPRGGGGEIVLTTGNLKINGNTGQTAITPTCVTITNGIVTGTGVCGQGSGGSVWTLAASTGVLYPINNTLDLLIGGTATSSARAAFLNIAGGNPTASVSAGAAGAAYLTANGTVQTTANQSLTLGGATSGNIIVNPRNGTAGGVVAPATDNVTDLGASPSARFRSLYLGPGSLHVDCTTGDGCSQGLDYAVGINTTSGNLEFGVNGNASNKNAMMVLSQGGNVGIGTTAPLGILDITQGASLSTFIRRTSGQYFEFRSNASGNSLMGFSDAGNGKNLVFGADGNSFGFQWQTGVTTSANGTARMTLTNIGSLGVGTTSPVASLDLRAQTSTFPIMSISGSTNAGFPALVVNETGTGNLFVASTSGTNKFIITNAGSVGVGNASPSYTLDVTGNIRATGTMYANNNGAAYFCGGDDACLNDINVSNTVGVYGVQDSTVGSIKLGSGGQTISGYNGKIGINNTAPGSLLTVTGGAIGGTFGILPSYAAWNAYGVGDGGAAIYNDSGSFATLMIVGSNVAGGDRTIGLWDTVKINGSSGYPLYVNQSNGGAAGIRDQIRTTGSPGNFMLFQSLSGASDYTNGWIAGSGGGVCYCSTSDQRLKENIVETRYGINDLMKIQVLEFNYIKDPTTTTTGFLAQQLYSAYPPAVTVGGDDPLTHPWSVDYSKITPLLVKSVQEQQRQLDTFKASVSAVLAGSLDTNSLTVNNLTTQTFSLGGVNINDYLGIDNNASSSASFVSPIAGFNSELLSLSSRVASLEAALTASSSAFQLSALSSPLSTFTASTGAELSLDKLDVNGAIITGSLNVLNYATVNELSVTGSIRAGLLTIKSLDNGGASISTLNGDLRLQDQGFGGIDILNGKVTIDTTGNIQSSGTITADKFNIDESNILSASVGEATIPQNATSAIVYTTAVTSKSKIFVTPKTKTGLPLSVTTQTAGTSFKVELIAPALQPLKFNWWVIN